MHDEQIAKRLQIEVNAKHDEKIARSKQMEINMQSQNEKLMKRIHEENIRKHQKFESVDEAIKLTHDNLWADLVNFKTDFRH